ncbi:rRNA-binding ribosome biosynthesis protein [Exophiala xenobiotica]|nr:rRNA-binding ribosome biosynthesis protein [Exophiala xenobiotica]KAK5397705.1 rRNA-binding ribosome biosynthesis protein [Exophiala xenobiotica]KAK5421199.1 rRNA-binding ribosome biosynthesis protein [Exophiala xenobiotica]KAK5456670.1 rRNA-binding ribosome biosynthesis protein [Exophiala xenobiotica]KAK5473492.1 rRNA-binding ribosome biosynthesis protein [Exophiala xenobiotica]
MAKVRKKKRTHVGNDDAPGKPGQGNRRPKSMVIRMGAVDIGPSVTQLARDFRAVMEPDTASRLKERRANKLKDYTAMAGPLGVTHVFLFSRSKAGNVHLRVATTPRGPTLTFRVQRYALSKDIAKAQRHPRGGGKEFLNAPLLVMNNFTSQPTGDANADPIKKQLESLTTTIFQSMFPPISPQATPLNSIKRILLLNRETQTDGSYIISLRHYAITTRRTGVSRRVRRFDPSEQRHREKKTGALPNLGKLEDVADYILDPASGGYTSASETELDTDAEVEVTQTTTQRVLSKREQQKQQNGDSKDKRKDPEQVSGVEKRAVKLVELGPRLRLRLVKVEEGVCEGRVMWNEFVTKTKGEEKELEEKWEKRRNEKEERKKVQRENVERKRQLKKNTKANAGEGGEGEQDEDEEWDSDELEDWDDLDDVNGSQDNADEDVDEDDEDEDMED